MRKTQSVSYTVTSNSVLSDDFIWTADVLASVANSSTVGVFQNNGQAQALIVRADGALCHLKPAAGENASGWTIAPIAGASGVTQAAAGVQSDGGVHGFYTDAAHTYHISLADNVWSAPNNLPPCSGLNLTTNSLTGELIAYGVDARGGLLLIRQQPGAGRWSAVSLNAPGSLAGQKPVLTLTDAASDWVMAVPGQAPKGGYLDVYQGSLTSIQSGPAHVATPNPVSQVVLGYFMNNSVLFLFTDTKNSIYTNVDSTTNVVQIPNLSVVNAAAVVDISNNLHLYAVDDGGKLSVLHQVGWDNASGPKWAPAIPLDSGLKMLFTDSDPLDELAFFAIDDADAIWRYQQNATTRLWAAAKAQSPGGAKSYRVPQYRTELAFVDQNGNPANALEVKVTASTTSAALVRGKLTPIGPSLPASFTTNAQGRVTLSTIASDVGSPTLHVSAKGLANAPPINPAASVHSYLSGAGPLNAGSSSQLPQFSATTLQQAKVNGAPLAPATQDPKNGSQLAQVAFSGVQQMFQIKTKDNVVAGIGPAPKVVAFALDFSNPDNPTYTPIATHDHYRALRHETFLAPELAAGLGDWWDSVKGFFQDVWEGIKNGVIAVTKFLVNVADATVDLAVKIGEEIHHLVGVVVSGIESVVSAVQGVFAWIGAEVEQLVDWLKMLFDWRDIANTAQALQQALSQSFPYLANEIETKGDALVNGFFSKLEDQVSTSFDKVLGQFSGGQSLASLLPRSTSPLALAVAAPPYDVRRRLAAGRLGAPETQLQSWSGNVQNNWLLEKIESFLGDDQPWRLVDALNAPLATLERAFEAVGKQFQEAFDDFVKFVTTALTDPKDFKTLGVAEFLGAAKHVALAALVFLDGIIEAFIQVLAAAVSAAGGLLTAPFELPFISALLESLASLFNIQFPKVSVASVFSLALAIPVTVLYKLVNGADSQPFPNGQLPVNELKSDLLGAESSDAKKAIQLTAAGLAALWALMDTGLDTVPDVNFLVFKLLDVIAPTLLQVFTWPTGIPFTLIPLDTPEDKAAFANWIIGWSLVGLDIALLVAGAVSWAPKVNIARYIEPVGKVVMTALGAISLIAGIVASSLGASGGAIAANILGPLPPLMQFLRLDSLEEGSEGVTLAIKLVIDFFAGEGLAVAIAAAE
jgi:hypothetical protein